LVLVVDTMDGIIEPSFIRDLCGTICMRGGYQIAQNRNSVEPLTPTDIRCISTKSL